MYWVQNSCSDSIREFKNGGAEKKVWKTQFGFKSKSGTFDALFLLRRVLDHLWAEKMQAQLLWHWIGPKDLIEFVQLG